MMSEQAITTPLKSRMAELQIRRPYSTGISRTIWTVARADLHLNR